MQYTTQNGDTFGGIAFALLNTGGDPDIVQAYAMGLANIAGIYEDDGVTPYLMTRMVLPGVTFTIPDSWLKTAPGGSGSGGGIQPAPHNPANVTIGGFTPLQLGIGALAFLAVTRGR